MVSSIYSLQFLPLIWISWNPSKILVLSWQTLQDRLIYREYYLIEGVIFFLLGSRVPCVGIWLRQSLCYL